MAAEATDDGQLQKFFINSRDRGTQDIITAVARSGGVDVVPGPWGVAIRCNKVTLSNILHNAGGLVTVYEAFRLKALCDTLECNGVSVPFWLNSALAAAEDAFEAGDVFEFRVDD